MLRIRLSMGGVRKRPVYKIVIADGRYPRDGKFIEKIGSYNPLLPKDKKERIKVEAERVKYWMSKGAQPTLRVSRILGEAQIMPMPKPGNNPKKLFLKRIEKSRLKKVKKHLKQKLKRKSLKQKLKRKSLKRSLKQKKRKNLKSRELKRKSLKRKSLKQKLKRKSLKKKLKRKNLKRSKKEKNQGLKMLKVKYLLCIQIYILGLLRCWNI